MIPILFHLGPINVYSYGLMLGIGFLLGSYVLALDLKKKGLDPNMASTITVLAVVFGISGAKILYLIEEWKSFLNNPIGMAFSPGGLTWYGGFALALAAVIIYVRRRKAPWLKVLDGIGLALIIAYGVGRVGCHLSGDGDYGAPTTLPWGTVYAGGIAKPTSALAEYFTLHPEAASAWHYDSLGSLFDRYDYALVKDDRLRTYVAEHPEAARLRNIDSLRTAVDGSQRAQEYRQDYPALVTRFDAVTPLHPTPIYELILGIIGFAILWRLRSKNLPAGSLFMIYLVLESTFRFFVEFLRLNPRLLFGLSEAQLLSILVFTAGVTGFLLLNRKRPVEARPAP